eukprot:3262900-Pyramimonas_sp.AAC.1
MPGFPGRFAAHLFNKVGELQHKQNKTTMAVESFTSAVQAAASPAVPPVEPLGRLSSRSHLRRATRRTWFLLVSRVVVPVLTTTGVPWCDAGVPWCGAGVPWHDAGVPWCDARLRVVFMQDRSEAFIAHLNLGQMHSLLERPEEALTSYTSALPLADTSAAAAQCLREAGTNKQNTRALSPRYLSLNRG